MLPILRVRVASSGWSGGPGLNTFYFRPNDATSSPTSADALNCVTRVHAGFVALESMYPNGWSGQVSGVVDVLEATTGALLNSIVTTTFAAALGGAPNGYASLATMILLRLNTLAFLGGRRVAGRSFLGPISNYADADGTPQAATEAFVTAFGAALGDMTGTSVPVNVVWSRPRAARTTPKVVAYRAGGTADVSSYSVPDRFAVLRSRRG